MRRVVCSRWSGVLLVCCLVVGGMQSAAASSASRINRPPIARDDPVLGNVEAPVTPGDLQADDQFGNAVAIDGNTAVVGATFGNGQAGAAYVYERVEGEWLETAKLVSPDPGAFEFFGWSVAIEGDTIVVGEFRDKNGDEQQGAAHVFTWSGGGWSHVAKLVAAPRVKNGEFGCDVAISGDTIAVGSYGYGAYGGAVYVFRGAGSSWTQEALIPTPSSGAFYFGSSVDLDGDTLIGGSHYDDAAGYDSGAAYVYTRAGAIWSYQQQLVGSDTATVDYFGWSVAVDGDNALVGAKYDDDLGNISGSVYHFRRAGTVWTQATKILPSDGAAQDEFGYDVSFDGQTAIVGAQGTSQAGQKTGRAYVYSFNGSQFSETARVEASDQAQDAYFGSAVAASGTTLLVGAYSADPRGTRSGQAYFCESGFVTDEDTVLYVDSPGPLVNDSDPDGDPIRLWDFSQGVHGTVSAFSNGAFSYTPDPGFNGWDSFTYLVTDDIGPDSNWATVRIFVTPVHDYIPIEGADRFETGAEAALAGFAESGAPTAVIATGRNFPDALGGSALAGALDAPLLLVDTASVPVSVAGALDTLGTTHAVILGGTTAVTDAVKTQLLAAMGAGSTVERIAGADRYETARKVADKTIGELGPLFDGVAFVATGANFPDALAAGPIAAAAGMPIYLASNTAGDAVTIDAMDDGGVSRVNVLGGDAVVTGATYESLVDEFGGANVDRLAGADRYETAARVAGFGTADAKLSWDGVGIATGEAFPDALAAGATLGRFRTVLVLSRPAALSAVTEAALSANRRSIDDVRYFGGTSALSSAVRARVKQVIEAL